MQTTIIIKGSIGNFILFSWGAFLSDASGNINGRPTNANNYTNFPNKVLINLAGVKIVAKELKTQPVNK